ncbi:MAG: UbiD family decarboxylase [Chloroflexi bacterium]|nr:UbiD family decarboxylase [Chloroflexota bacterium]
MAYYKDLREHIDVLEADGKLVRIKREINKDTELMPLVRWQLRGLPEEERKAFLFSNVVDAKGKRYDIPVLVASHAASKAVYALGMMCPEDKIVEKWTDAQLHPVPPRIVADGPVHEEVHRGEHLLEHGGLEEFPVPISTPGFDNAPYLTCANWITKDPDTGIRNMGNYRAMLKSPTRTGLSAHVPKHLRAHWEKCRKRGKPLPAAIVIGAMPAIGFTAATRLLGGIDELAVAGGIAGEPVELVKCKTVDIEVPATAEIVIEGEVPTDYMEREAPFGEFTGYMGRESLAMCFNVTCITHRKNPIYNAFISQFCPSESSKLQVIGNEAALYKFLRYDCGLPVLDVAFPDICASNRAYCVIKMKKENPLQAWQALHNAVGIDPSRKFVIAVDDDIDPRDFESVTWAMAYRVQPHRDVRTVEQLRVTLDPSVTPPSEGEGHAAPGAPSGSALLIDATRKWDYPPVSLPRKEFMERARQIWEEEGLPALNPRQPWYGYSLGYWTEENDEEAELAIRGEYKQTGEKLARQRIQM